MRWPFGPPHLTLKPSQKKNKTPKKARTKKSKNQKQKQNKNQHQKQSNNKNKNKANKTETKATQKTKTNTRNTKTPKPFTPKTNKNKPPHKSPKMLEKQAFLTLLELCPTHQKQTTITLKPQKTNPKKCHFCHVQKQRTIFHKFSVFFNISFLLLKSCVLLKTLVFSEKHSFSKLFRVQSTVSKTHFFHPCQKHLFQRKGVIFWFWAISAETTIFIVFPGLHCFGPKKILAKTDSVHEHALFSPFLTEIVSGNFC